MAQWCYPPPQYPIPCERLILPQPLPVSANMYSGQPVSVFGYNQMYSIPTNNQPFCGYRNQ